MPTRVSAYDAQGNGRTPTLATAARVTEMAVIENDHGLAARSIVRKDLMAPG